MTSRTYNQLDCWIVCRSMTCSKNNMATEKKNMDYILYNLLVHAEWPLEGEVLVRIHVEIIVLCFVICNSLLLFWL